jgi:hypothetical protein
MLEEREEGPIMTAEMGMQPEEREEGPTSIDVTDKQISIGEAPAIVPQEEKLQEQNIGIEQVQEESGISKKKQKRRRTTTSYLTNISKQVEKNGNQINKIVMIIQSLQRQKQTKAITEVGESKSQLQSIKRIRSQFSQLQKQVTRIQNEIQKIRTAPASKTRFRKLSSTTIKPRSKKSKSSKIIKVKRQRRIRR